MATRRDGGDGDGGIDVVDRPGTGKATQAKPRTERPPLYKVILHNDDFTPPDLVVHVLRSVFKMDEGQAFKVMMTAHTTGLCLCGVFAAEVAEQKVIDATELGRKYEAALRFSKEPE